MAQWQVYKLPCPACRREQGAASNEVPAEASDLGRLLSYREPLPMSTPIDHTAAALGP